MILVCTIYVAHYYIGVLPAVSLLVATHRDSIISLTWFPPFSQNVFYVHPDITGYCVGVVNSTSSLMIHSQCGITGRRYNYTVSSTSTPCDTYTFTVTPVNIVGNGTSASVEKLQIQIMLIARGRRREEINGVGWIQERSHMV